MSDKPLADVVVLPPIPGTEILTYAIPAEMDGAVEVGTRVLVPLGKRKEAGVVVAVGNGEPAERIRTKLKPLCQVLDPEPSSIPEVIELCRWGARYYCVSFGELVAAALPIALKVSTERIIELARSPSQAELGALNDRERALLDMIGQGRLLSTRKLARLAHGPDLRPAVGSLRAKGILRLKEKTPGEGSRRADTADWYEIRQPLDRRELEQLAKRSPAQYRLYQLLSERRGPVAKAELAAVAGTAACRALARRGLVALAPPPRPSPETPLAAAGPALTAEQALAADAICKTIEERRFEVFLLHGVTGSGKTEVYLRAAERAVEKGLSVMMLVPEIALTHQLAKRIEGRFPGNLAVLHSALSKRERLAQHQRIARGHAAVVVGARSAVFAPARRLGLIIVDEEHDPSYKQEESPRYNARDLAIVRARNAPCPVVLGSATPSLESFARAIEGRYRLLELPRRVMERAMPRVEIVDLRQTRTGGPLRSGSGENRDAAFFVSPKLLAELENTLRAGEQSLLFLNRRGFANYLQCVCCGEPVLCPNCSVTLTLHASRGILLCHHCNHSRPPLDRCPACGEESLRPLGGGTERIESALRRLLPRARIERLDRDTTGRRGSLAAILARWERHEIDILIGTQMVTKGHDIPGVTLVGVILADVALGMPDFRASERAFQLLAQVAGRAGRGSQAGKVIVQTLRPAHPSVVAAQTHDYQSFAVRELAERKSLLYPPFWRLALLRVESKQPRAAEQAANTVGEWCRRVSSPTVKVTGPAPAPLERLRGVYRWHLMLRSPARSQLGRILDSVLASWRRGSHRRSCRLVIDVDPASVL